MAVITAEHTGQTVEQIEKDADRDRWFTAQQALEYGFVDQIVTRVGQVAADVPISSDGVGASEPTDDSDTSSDSKK